MKSRRRPPRSKQGSGWRRISWPSSRLTDGRRWSHCRFGRHAAPHLVPTSCRLSTTGLLQEELEGGKARLAELESRLVETVAVAEAKHQVLLATPAQSTSN